MALDDIDLADLSLDESKRVKRLLERGITIPSQPRVLRELQQNLSGGVADVRSLARIIIQDPGVGAMLFKLVQSAAYREFQPFTSLEDVLQVLGLQATTNLIRAITLAAALPAKHNRKAFDAYWTRSQAVSELAMLIAEERISVCNIFPDQTCLAGIFHDCGVPVLMQRFPTYCQEMGLDTAWARADLAKEDARFNADHCVIGYLIGRHWKLPDFICDSIRFHHDINRIGNHEARTMVAILQLAIHLYYVDQGVGDAEWPVVRAEVLDELGLGADTLPEVVDVILDRYHLRG
jgi:HD-like signal output (HDOD) protein